jgi:stage III sporulation protein AA
MSPDSYRPSEDLDAFMAVLPQRVSRWIMRSGKIAGLQEIVLDLGALPEIRFENALGERVPELGAVTVEDIAGVTAAIGVFNGDNRAGLEGTLHRISAIRNRMGVVVGLTCRVGRAIYGAVDVLGDLIATKKSILFLGPPGIGKTTKLRESARLLAAGCQRRVVIVDTSNEIAGDGNIPHPGIGLARRMQVPAPDRQHAVMIEAVENHMPEVIVVDEIGTQEEAQAARTIAERGVQLIATAHGYALENIIKNPMLSDLVGGIQSVILGDEEAKLRGTQKTVLERKALPTFDVIVELRDRDVIAIYHDTRQAVDGILRGERVVPEIRRRRIDGVVETEPEHMPDREDVDLEPDIHGNYAAPVAYNVFPYGIAYERVTRVVSALGAPVRVAKSMSDADFVLTVRKQMSEGGLPRILEGRQMPVHVLKRNNVHDIERFFRNLYHIPESEVSAEDDALFEIGEIIKQVRSEKRIMDASPRSSYLRRIQHQEVSDQGFHSISIGVEPTRRLRVYPKP